jgi:hypothetical protein
MKREAAKTNRSTAKTLSTNQSFTCTSHRDQKLRQPMSFAYLLSFAAILLAISLSSCAGYTTSASNSSGNGSNVNQSNAAVLSPSTTSLSFGTVSLGHTATQMLTIANVGTVTANLSPSITGQGFSLVNGSATLSILAGQSVQVQIEVTPQAAGPVTGTLSVSGDAANAPLTVSLSGTAAGSTQAQVAATPASASFGNVTVGNTNTQSIQLMNAGNAALSFSQVTISGTGFSVTGLSTASTIPAGGSISFDAVFTPTSATSTTGSIVLSTNGAPAQVTIPLSGTGTSATKVLSLSTTNVAFGTVALGSNHTQTVTVTNTGNANVTIAGLSYSGTGFSATGLTSGLILTPSQAATVSISFAPASTGSYTGNVSIASNATVSPNNIAVTGGSHSVLLNWGASSSSSVTGYYVYRGTAVGQYAKLDSSTPVSASQMTYTDSSIQSGTYYYVVTSVDSSNVESAYSSPVTAVIP